MTTQPIRADIDEDKHRRLKAKLAAEGITIVDWIRTHVDAELEKGK